MCIVETHWPTPFNSCLTVAQTLFSYSKTFSVFPLLFWIQQPIFFTSEINLLICGTMQGQFVIQLFCEEQHLTQNVP